MSLPKGGEPETNSRFPVNDPLQPDSSRDSLIPALLTVAGLAQVLGVSHDTVYRLVANRALPVLRVRGSLRFTQRDVERYLERCRVGSRRNDDKI